MTQQACWARRCYQSKIFYAFSSMSIGAVRVVPALFKSHHEVAGAMSNVKKEAKKTLGNSLFIDRRLATS